MPAWLGQLASGSALALAAHFLFIGIRVKPLRGLAWLGSGLAGLALAYLAGAFRALPVPIWLGLIAGAVAGAVLLSHRFLALHMADRKAMQALSRAYADLQASARLRDLGVSAASISHEIRNYAAALKGNAALLDRGMGADARLGELDRIRASAQRMEEISRGIGAFAGAAGPVRQDPLDLEAVIRSALEHGFPDARAEMRRSGAAYLRGDAVRLEQAFVNFFRNARDAGAKRLEIRLTTWRGKLIVALEDDGSGCPPEDLERMAVPFFSRKCDGGTGLGCSIAESILRAHGATFRAYAKNVLGEGRSGLVLNLVFPVPGTGRTAAGGELSVAAGLGPARENLIRPMLHLGLRPRILDPALGARAWTVAPGELLFLDREAADRFAAGPAQPAVFVGSRREAVRSPGGEAFLFSEEALAGVLEGDGPR